MTATETPNDIALPVRQFTPEQKEYLTGFMPGVAQPGHQVGGRQFVDDEEHHRLGLVLRQGRHEGDRPIERRVVLVLLVGARHTIGRTHRQR